MGVIDPPTCSARGALPEPDTPGWTPRWPQNTKCFVHRSLKPVIRIGADSNTVDETGVLWTR